MLWEETKKLTTELLLPNEDFRIYKKNTIPDVALDTKFVLNSKLLTHHCPAVQAGTENPEDMRFMWKNWIELREPHLILHSELSDLKRNLQVSEVSRIAYFTSTVMEFTSSSYPSDHERSDQSANYFKIKWWVCELLWCTWSFQIDEAVIQFQNIAFDHRFLERNSESGFVLTDYCRSTWYKWVQNKQSV